MRLAQLVYFFVGFWGFFWVGIRMLGPRDYIIGPRLCNWRAAELGFKPGQAAFRSHVLTITRFWLSNVSNFLIFCLTFYF